MSEQSVLFTQIKDRGERLSRNQRVLAKYIVDHYQSVAFATVKQLAAQSRVSEATIVRFAKALDFKGYPELQKEIRRIVRADLKGTERFQLTDADDQTGTGPLAAVIAKELENIATLQQTLDDGSFRQAVAALGKSSEILIVGTRSTVPLAHHLWFGLNKIGFNATRFTAVTTETYERLNRLDARACVVVVGFPRYLQELVDVLRFARRMRLKTLTITDSPFSALRGDISLYSPAESATFVAAHCAPLILINGLLHHLSLRDKARTMKALNHFEALAEGAAYFHKQ
jgi:DNA-binding MurR/RpiR family transcriptional regulator